MSLKIKHLVLIIKGDNDITKMYRKKVDNTIRDQDAVCPRGVDPFYMKVTRKGI